MDLTPVPAGTDGGRGGARAAGAGAGTPTWSILSPTRFTRRCRVHYTHALGWLPTNAWPSFQQWGGALVGGLFTQDAAVLDAVATLRGATGGAPVRCRLPAGLRWDSAAESSAAMPSIALRDRWRHRPYVRNTRHVKRAACVSCLRCYVICVLGWSRNQDATG